MSQFVDMDVRQLGLRMARSVGLIGDDVQDCTGEWTLRVLRGSVPSLLNNEISQADRHRYLCVAARNFAIDYRRKTATRQKIEVPWPRWSVDDRIQEDQVWEPTAVTPSPENISLAWNISESIVAAIESLSETQKELFVRHFLLEESIVAIADALGKEPNAARQATLRARSRVISYLERHDIHQCEVLIQSSYVWDRLLSPRLIGQYESSSNSRRRYNLKKNRP